MVRGAPALAADEGRPGGRDPCSTQVRAVTEHPPEPPALAREDVDRLIAWSEESAAWLRAEQAQAARHGHPVTAEDRARAAFHDDVALHLREAYDRS